MPRRLIGALFAFLLTITAGAGVAPGAASPAGSTSAGAGAAATARFQDDPLVEDEFSSFTMPGLTPD
ncbi:MAG: hypothetical protein ACRDJC_23500, partial [Thermomicrobiales bacterium]